MITIQSLETAIKNWTLGREKRNCGERSSLREQWSEREQVKNGMRQEYRDIVTGKEWRKEDDGCILLSPYSPSSSSTQSLSPSLLLFFSQQEDSRLNLISLLLLIYLLFLSSSLFYPTLPSIRLIITNQFNLLLLPLDPSQKAKTLERNPLRSRDSHPKSVVRGRGIH